MQTVQPSTTRNLAAMAGDAHTALAYGKDIADLLTGDDTVRPEEADLLAAGLAVALSVAAREFDERDVDAGVVFADAAADASAGVAALRNWGPAATVDRVLLAVAVRDAMVFQLTDLDEQD